MSLPLLRPFRAVRPASGRAAEVAAPPYDVVTTDEVRAWIEGRPWSFFRVSRPEAEMPPDTDPHGDDAYARARENWRRMIDTGVLVRDPTPAYYAYRVSVDGHVQTGIAAAASMAAYEANRVRKHELTRPDKELDRARQIDAIDAHTGPVFATHRADTRVAGILGNLDAKTPIADVTVDFARHQVWALDDDASIAALSQAFEAMDAVYIADGHHRSAAALQVARWRRTPDGDADDAHERFLIVSFPDDEVRILDYNRVVRDLNGLSAEAFLAAVGERFAVTPESAAVRPYRAGVFGMHLGGTWYRLEAAAGADAEASPVERLDITRLTEILLGPVLGIGDPRTDPRIDFVGGGRGLGALEQRVESGDWAVAFSLFPTALADLMAVADAGQVMPPKSTWFEPKLADGLLSLPLD